MRITFSDLFILDAWAWGLKDEPALLIGMHVIGALDSFVIDNRLKELHLRARN